MHHSETTSGHAEAVGDGAPNNDCQLTVRLCRGIRKPLKQPEAAEAARSVAAPGLCKPAQRTGCCTIRKQQAAMLCHPPPAGG
ncbi:MAG: hypothetical protein LBD24_03950 [Spirochaetaceae bacterium]|nr:hypothetical protein [Spirochaetaceae bacterium]